MKGPDSQGNTKRSLQLLEEAEAEGEGAPAPSQLESGLVETAEKRRKGGEERRGRNRKGTVGDPSKERRPHPKAKPEAGKE